MTTYVNDALHNGIARFKAGDKQQASVLFHQALQLDPNNQLAWLWLASCSEGDEKQQCLERVIQIDPTNEMSKRAEQGLAHLASQRPKPQHPATPAAVSASTEQAGQRVCVRCGKAINLFGLLRYNSQTQRCGGCEKAAQQALHRFRNAFISFCRDGILTEADWQSLRAGTAHDNITMDEALAFVRADALQLLERNLSFAFADGLLSAEEEAAMRHLQQSLLLPDEMARPVLERMDYLKSISTIRQGHLQTVQASAHLDTGELCHLETRATYHKVTKRATTLVQGRLIATNKQLHFLSDEGGWTIRLKNIMQVTYDVHLIDLELNTRRGNGRYEVPDPLKVWAIVDTLVRLEKRQILAPQGGQNSRHIPHDVKTAVWQRDSGQCIQCGASDYLEFDHIIPHSKGGANTVNNVQLLCRRCNLAKGDRI